MYEFLRQDGEFMKECLEGNEEASRWPRRVPAPLARAWHRLQPIQTRNTALKHAGASLGVNLAPHLSAHLPILPRQTVNAHTHVFDEAMAAGADLGATISERAKLKDPVCIAAMEIMCWCVRPRHVSRPQPLYPGAETIISPGPPGYALYPSAQVP